MELRLAEFQRRLELVNEQDECDDYSQDDGNDYNFSERFGEITHDWPWEKHLLQRHSDHAESFIFKATQRIEDLIKEAEELQAFFGKSLKQSHSHDTEHQSDQKSGP